MNAQAEPSSPESQTEKPNHLRVALLSILALALAAHSLLSQGGALSKAGPAQSPGPETYQTANSILAEVHEELGQTACHYADKGAALARLKELPSVIPAWQQTARVEPSELLRSLQRIWETTNCPAAQGKPSNPTGATEVEKLRATLEKQLEQDVRSLFARLRKAEREGDRKSSAQNVSELQELLQYHRGPLGQHLDRLARLYQGS